MDIITEYIQLYITGFSIGVGMIGFPVMMGTAIGFIYRICANW